MRRREFVGLIGNAAAWPLAARAAADAGDRISQCRVAGSFLRTLELIGIPELNLDGESMNDIAYDAAKQTIDSLPRPRRRDHDELAESVRRAVRNAVAAHWGKKPMCHVHVLTV